MYNNLQNKTLKHLFHYWKYHKIRGKRNWACSWRWEKQGKKFCEYMYRKSTISKSVAGI